MRPMRLGLQNRKKLRAEAVNATSSAQTRKDKSHKISPSIPVIPDRRCIDFLFELIGVYNAL